MKKLTVFLFACLIAITACTKEKDNITSMEIGQNNLPVSMDKFPAFNSAQKVDAAEVWIFFNDVTKKDSYIKELQNAGFTPASDGYFEKGNAEVWFDDENDSHTVVFTLRDIEGDIGTPVATVLKAFPPFTLEQFGSMYSIDIDIYYNGGALPTATVDEYIKNLNTAGFKYSAEDDDYQLEISSRQYYFAVMDDETGKYYTWSILYF